MNSILQLGYSVHKANESKSLVVQIGLSNWMSVWAERVTKGHSLCKQCLHDLQFIKKGPSSPNLSKLARADMSCQFKKTRYLCRHCLQKECKRLPATPRRVADQCAPVHEASVSVFTLFYKQCLRGTIFMTCQLKSIKKQD